jgi:hypothetical protein
MRFTADKVDGTPEHALSTAELKDALGALPHAWTSRVKLVRLSSSMSSWQIASFSRPTGRLILATRGRKKDEVIRAMMRVLYQDATLSHPIPEWRLSSKQRLEIDRKVDPQSCAITNAPKG